MRGEGQPLFEVSGQPLFGVFRVSRASEVSGSAALLGLRTLRVCGSWRIFGGLWFMEDFEGMWFMRL